MELVPILSDFAHFRTHAHGTVYTAAFPWRPQTSLYKGIPIDLREKFLEAWKAEGERPVKLSFRGPRAHRRTGGWANHAAQNYCLRADAKTFSVYLR